MDDRTLLELAAKAAGIHIDKSTTNGGGMGNTGFDLMGNVKTDCHNGTTWNPLTDDGDALRLAVKLNMDVDIDRRDITVLWAEDDGAVYEIKERGEKSGGDPLAATRRAIVRAAAEIELSKSAVSAPGAVEGGRT